MALRPTFLFWVLLSTTVVLLASAAEAAPTPVGAPPPAQAPMVQTPLFQKGSESFIVTDKDGKTPTFRLLHDTPSKRLLATAIVAALNAQGAEPQLPQQSYIDLAVQKIELEPVKAQPDRLAVNVRISGHDLSLEKTIDRKAFLNGQSIQVDFPKKVRDVSLFSVESKGKLNMRLDPKTSVIKIENANARLDIGSFGQSGSESVQFSGTGVRQTQ